MKSSPCELIAQNPHRPDYPIPSRHKKRVAAKVQQTLFLALLILFISSGKRPIEDIKSCAEHHSEACAEGNIINRKAEHQACAHADYDSHRHAEAKQIADYYADNITQLIKEFFLCHVHSILFTARQIPLLRAALFHFREWEEF